MSVSRRRRIEAPAEPVGESPGGGPATGAAAGGAAAGSAAATGAATEGTPAGYRPLHVKKAPPLPGQKDSGQPAMLTELGALPMPALVERLRHYGLAAHEG